METEAKTDFEPLEPTDLSFGEAGSQQAAALAPAAAESAQPAGAIAAKRRFSRPAWVLLVLGAVMGAGVWLAARPPQQASSRVAPPSPAESAIREEGKPPAAAAASSPSAVEDSNGWAVQLREVDDLRRLLYAKKEAILRVKQEHEYGILELEEETQGLLKQARIDSPALARKHHEIDLLLQTIQRRLRYRAALDAPLQWLEAASEELLYLKRRASIDLLVAEAAEGIDMQLHSSAIDLALQKYQPDPPRLSIHPGSVAVPSLDAIAKRLMEQTRRMAPDPAGDRNQQITAEVCSGNLTAAGELTRLSLRAARCLAESGAKQLFLNRLTELTPLAARKLSEWPGEWLCLNGLAGLDADAARHLFAWPGAWISLNGIGELSAGAGPHVAGWRGRQLELMGLHSPLAAEHLLQWEAAGGRLFVSDRLRRAIGPAVGQPVEN